VALIIVEKCEELCKKMVHIAHILFGVLTALVSAYEEILEFLIGLAIGEIALIALEKIV